MEETGRAMQDRMKEHDRDIHVQLAHTQTSAVSEHANETGHLPIWKEVKFIERDPHWYTRRVKEAIHIKGWHWVFRFCGFGLRVSHSKSHRFFAFGIHCGFRLFPF